MLENHTSALNTLLHCYFESATTPLLTQPSDPLLSCLLQMYYCLFCSNSQLSSMTSSLLTSINSFAYHISSCFLPTLLLSIHCHYVESSHTIVSPCEAQCLLFSSGVVSSRDSGFYGDNGVDEHNIK